jgi:hypothetical protein
MSSSRKPLRAKAGSSALEQHGASRTMALVDGLETLVCSADGEAIGRPVECGRCGLNRLLLFKYCPVMIEHA